MGEIDPETMLGAFYQEYESLSEEQKSMQVTISDEIATPISMNEVKSSIMANLKVIEDANIQINSLLWFANKALPIIKKPEN